MKTPHLPISVQVSFVSHHQHGKFVPIFHPEHTLIHFPQFVERFPITQREDQEEALARPHVLLPHGAELLLAGSVEDIQLGHGIIDHALLGVGVFNGGVIVRHKVAL